jgi:LysM repeat protein
MNDPFAPVGGTGYGMKAFFVMVIVFIIFMLFVSNSMSAADLSNNGAVSAQAPVLAAAPPASAPQVITIQESAANRNNVVPVTGSCTDPYTVQAGDTLSQIAEVCSTTMAAIRLANPQVTDANLIYPGQQLRIPGAAVTQPVPVTGPENDKGFILPTATAVVPVTGLYPQIAANTGLQIKGIGYPANTPVNIAIGPQAQGYTVVASGVTDASGNITTHITTPSAPDPQIPWVVVVTTTGSPPTQAISRPFTIGPAQ